MMHVTTGTSAAPPAAVRCLRPVWQVSALAGAAAAVTTELYGLAAGAAGIPMAAAVSRPHRHLDQVCPGGGAPARGSRDHPHRHPAAQPGSRAPRPLAGGPGPAAALAAEDQLSAIPPGQPGPGLPGGR
jgi:hypothetical protein